MQYINSRHWGLGKLIKVQICEYHFGCFVINNKDRWGWMVLVGTLVYRIDVHARLLILRKNSPLHGLILFCTFIVYEKKFPLHVYSILQVYWYLSCTFINFEKKFPPARPYFGLHVYCFLRIFPSACLFRPTRLFGSCWFRIRANSTNPK